MSRVTLLVLAVLAATAFAGCSKAPPSGDLASGSLGVMIDGNAMIDYVAEVRPAGDVPEVGGNDALCPPPGIGLPECVPPSSNFKVHFMALPAPGGGTYEVVLANASGQLPVGALVMDANNMWEIDQTFPEDYSGRFDRIELRLGEFILATAATAEGTQTFAVASDLSAVSATGTYSGKVLNVTVSGLPEGSTYTGYLYTLDEASGLLTRQDPFPIQNGANEYTAPMNVADYAEFHIHVGSSMVNLYKMSIAVA